MRSLPNDGNEENSLIWPILIDFLSVGRAYRWEARPTFLLRTIAQNRCFCKVMSLQNHYFEEKVEDFSSKRLEF